MPQIYSPASDLTINCILDCDSHIFTRPAVARTQLHSQHPCRLQRQAQCCFLGGQTFTLLGRNQCEVLCYVIVGCRDVYKHLDLVNIINLCLELVISPPSLFCWRSVCFGYRTLLRPCQEMTDTMFAGFKRVFA